MSHRTRPGPVLRAGCAAALALLAACTVPPRVEPVPVPPARPADLAPPPPPQAPAGPGRDSRALAEYYQRLQDDLLAKGLLRTDGGGPDTPYGTEDLLRNFERIAFFDEYARGAGLRPSLGEPGRLKRWTQPVRVAVTFGDTVPRDQRVIDRNEIAAYTARLARVTGHPIATASSEEANFHVLIMGEDDRDALIPEVQRLVPNINPRALAIFEDLPRAIHCLVLAFSGSRDGYDYARAVALVRAEHPELLRRSCIHEELAQGLGLANDSPRARPSIFNDDDEFALLTEMDERMLQLLYDPALRPGMSLEEARPILREKAQALVGEAG